MPVPERRPSWPGRVPPVVSQGMGQARCAPMGRASQRPPASFPPPSRSRPGPHTEGTRQMSGHAAQVKEHMEVVGSDGKHVGTVDHMDGDRIKLTRKDDPDGSGQHHHYIPASSIAAVEGNKVKLSM